MKYNEGYRKIRIRKFKNDENKTGINERKEKKREKKFILHKQDNKKKLTRYSKRSY